MFMLRFPYIFRLLRHGYITDPRISMGPIVKHGARRVPATFVYCADLQTTAE